MGSADRDIGALTEAVENLKDVVRELKADHASYRVEREKEIEALKQEVKALNELISAFMNQAKGATWLGRALWAAATLIIGLIGGIIAVSAKLAPLLMAMPK